MRIGVARVALGARAPPTGRRKKFMCQIYRVKLYVHLQTEQAEQESSFLGNWGALYDGSG